MIDYEKLKKANELILKANEKYSLATHVSCQFDTLYRLYSNNCTWYQDFVDIDELLNELKELTREKEPEPKYKTGQEVWVHSHNRIDKAIINGKELDNRWFVQFEDGSRAIFSEENIYPTKQSLIEAQITYWVDELKSLPEFKKLTGQCVEYESMAPKFEGDIKGFNHSEEHLEKVDICINQHQDDINRCQHEIDYGHLLLNPCQCKCKKCGEFYR